MKCIFSVKRKGAMHTNKNEEKQNGKDLSCVLDQTYSITCTSVHKHRMLDIADRFCSVLALTFRHVVL